MVSANDSKKDAANLKRERQRNNGENNRNSFREESGLLVWFDLAVGL
jgi:hypothetical protein